MYMVGAWEGLPRRRPAAILAAMADQELSPLARALGRIPTGLYLVTTSTPEGPLGFLGSFVMQVAFDPPTVCVAIGRDRAHLAAVRKSGAFGVSILDSVSRRLMTRFLGKLPEGESPFDGQNLTPGAAGSPLFTDALASLECRLTGEHDAGDHIVVFGTVTEGRVSREGEPSLHLRKNGLSY